MFTWSIVAQEAFHISSATCYEARPEDEHFLSYDDLAMKQAFGFITTERYLPSHQGKTSKNGTKEGQDMVEFSIRNNLLWRVSAISVTSLVVFLHCLRGRKGRRMLRPPIDTWTTPCRCSAVCHCLSLILMTSH
jgi:hypothetical protein